MKLTLLLALIFLSLFLNAQTYFGLRGGLNFANVSTSEDGDILKNKIVGANSAVFFDFPAGNKIRIQPEVNFVQKGYKIKKSVTRTYLTKLNYWDVTVLCKYNFGTASKNKGKRNRKEIIGYIVTGPSIGGASSGFQKDLSDGNTFDLEFNNGEHFNLDIGMLLGTGIGIPSSRRGNIILDIRYNLGLFNILDSPPRDGNVRNRGIIISLGYAFRIKA